MSKSFLRVLSMVLITIFGFNACEELEPVNPADPAYTLKAPTLVSVQSITDVQIDLTWQKNEVHTEEFVVSRKTGAESYRVIGTVAKNILTFTDTACVLGVEYSYVVQGKVESNVSANSNTITKATTFPGPGNMNVFVISDESVRLTWTDNTGFESGFKIERESGSGFTEIGTVSADVTVYTDTGLIFGQSYNYRVAAYSSINTSSWATITTATEFPAPSDLSANSVSDIEIELAWSDNTVFEDGFKIERDSGSGFTEIGTVGSDVTEYTDTGLTPGQNYDYRVAAYTSINTSSWVTITVATEFPAPSALSANPLNDSEILLTWTDNTSYEMGFKIESDGGSGFAEIGTVSSDVTEYTDTGLTFGQDYSYRVAAFTSANISSWATITAATVFPAPSNLSASAISDSEIELTWTDNTDYETGFKIERDAGNGFANVGTVTADATEYTDSGLNYGQSYSYRVAAYTSANSSDYSPTATFNTDMVVDIDGNVYKTVQIGNQVWMAENLKVIHFRDGTAIANVTDNAEWATLTTEAYCIYNNNDSNAVDMYGALYNWYAIVDGRNIAPEGWHVPTDDEWTELETYLSNNGHSGTEGSTLKSSAGWVSGGDGTDDYGFTALPGGYRDHTNGDYASVSLSGYFWSATEGNSNDAWARRLSYSQSSIYRNYYNKRFAFSIRCLRD